MSPSAPARPGLGVQGAISFRLAGLGNRFVELFGRKLPPQAFAAEMARLIIEAVKLKAVAILSYDQQRDRLALLADQGLNDEARAALGAGGDCTWEIPLRGLRNRRISVIEAAHQNPFVPRSLINLSPTSLSVASVPIFYEHEATGLLLLFAVGSRAFPDGQLQTLSQAVRVCGRGLRTPDASAVRARLAKRPAAADDPDAPLAGEHAAATPSRQASTVPAGDESEALSPQLRLVETPNPRALENEFSGSLVARVQSLEHRLAHARDELDRSAKTISMLTASGNALVRERDSLAQQLAEIERQRETEIATQRAEVDGLQERLLATDGERARHQRLAEDRHTRAQQSIAALEREREALSERVQAAESITAELQTGLATLRGERGRLVSQVENLGTRLRVAEETLQRTQGHYAEERVATDADREAWKTQASTLRAELAQRSEQVATLDADLRSAVVGRDAAVSQLQAARAEIDRLVTLTEDVGRNSSQLDAARASAVAESAALSRALEGERAARVDTEQALRSELSVAQATAEQRAAEVETLRAELGARTRAVVERDEQLSQLRDAGTAARQAEVAWLETQAGLRSELAALSARLEQSTVERDRGLAERESLRLALAEMRQRADQADVAHAAAVGQLQAEAAELHRHVETLTAERAGLLDRQQRASDDTRGFNRRLAESQRRSEELSELLQQRDAALEAAGAERENQSTQIAALTGQLQASHEALERLQTRYAEEQAGLAADRDGWKAQAEAARTELAQRAESLVAREHDLRAAIVARDAVVVDLQTAREELDCAAAAADDLRHTVTRSEAARSAAAAESAGLRQALEADRARHLDAEHALRATVATLQTEGEQLAATAALLREELSERTHGLAERDERLAALRGEIDALRRQSSDRGVLAQQANELGSKVVELEQQLAAARGESARAERQRAALAESLDAARHRESEAAAAAARERSELHSSLDRLTQERSRLEAQHAAQQGEIDALRATLTEVQASLQQTRAAQATAEAGGRDAQQQLGETQRQLEALQGVVQERDAAVAAAAEAQRQGAMQLAALREELRLGQEALEAAYARSLQEHTTLQADREVWEEHASKTRQELERLAAEAGELDHTVAQLEAARSRAVAESASLQHSLEEERGAHQRAVDTLRAELASLHSTVEQLSGETATLADAVADRDAQLTALRQSEEEARHAETAWERDATGLRTELTTLRAQLHESATECEQLREARAAVERQLTLVVATQGAEEQALAQGLQAAREQVAQLEQERSTLQTALTEVRQRLDAAGSAHATALKQAQADATQLRKQVKSLTAAKTKLTERLDGVEQQRRTQVARTEDEGRRAAALAERCDELEHSLSATETRRAATEDTATQLRADLEALRTRLQARDAECARLVEAQAELDQELTRVRSSHGDREQALEQTLDTTRTALAAMEQERAALRSTLSEAEQHASETASVVARLQTESDDLRAHLQTVAAERTQLTQRLERSVEAESAHAERFDAESRRAAGLAEQCARLQQLAEEAETQRATLDGELARTRAEIAALRQQSADRGVLAHQAAELESRVVELEQEVAAVRGEAARAERQRAAVAEELEQARQHHGEALATLLQEHASLQVTVQELNDARGRAESEKAAQQGQLETQRATFADLQATLEQAQAERVNAEARGQDAAQRLADAHRRLEEISATVQQRDAALESAGSDRRRLSAQVAKLTSQLRASQDALESAQGRDALERAALEAERNSWKSKAEVAVADRDHTAAAAAELQQAARQLEAARDTVAAEAATLYRTLDTERASRAQIEQLLRADLNAARAEGERLSTDATALASELAERDAQIDALRQERESARQAEIEGQRTAGALRAEVAALTAQLEENGAQVRQLFEQHENVQRQLVEATAARSQSEHAKTETLQATQQRIAQLEQSSAELQDALADARKRLTEAEAVRTEMVGQLQGEAGDLRKQLAGLAGARDALTERLENAEQAHAVQAGHLEAESRRATVLGEQCSQLEQSLVTTEARRAALSAELAQARAEVGALQQHSADRGALARQASEMGAKVGELEQQVAVLHSETAAAERQQVALTAELEAVRREQAQAAVAAERQREALEESVQRLSDERDRLEAERAGQRAEVQAQHAVLADLRAAVERSDADRVLVEEGQLELTQRIAETQRRLDDVTELLRQREVALAAAVAERQRNEEALRIAETAAAQLVNERDALSRQVHEVTVQLEENRTTPLPAARRETPVRKSHETPEADTPAEVDVDGEAPALPADDPLVIERSAPLGVVTEPPAAIEAASEETTPAPASVSARPAGELVLLDEGPLQIAAGDALRGAGFEVTLAVPTEAVVDEIARRKVKCVLLNLGVGATAWHTLKALRERVGTRNVPVLAYVMTPQSPAGFCFGRAEYALWPNEPARVVERLIRMRPKLKRLLVASADVDGMGKLRGPLSQEGISSSMVLDGKQALEFVTMTDPEAAILHVSPSCSAIARAVIGLRTDAATRDLPLLILLDKAAAPGEDAFFAGTNRQLLGKPFFQFSQLPEEIARLVG